MRNNKIGVWQTWRRKNVWWKEGLRFLLVLKICKFVINENLFIFS